MSRLKPLSPSEVTALDAQHRKVFVAVSDDEDVSERVIMARLRQGGWQVAVGSVRRILGQLASRGYVAMSPANGRLDASASWRRARVRSPEELAAIAIKAREKREPLQEGKTMTPVSAPTPPPIPDPVSVAIDALAEIKASVARLEDAILAVGAAVEAERSKCRQLEALEGVFRQLKSLVA